MRSLIEKLEYGVSPRETLASLADRLGGMLPVEIEEYHIPLMNFVPAYFESDDAKTRKNARGKRTRADGIYACAPSRWACIFSRTLA